MDIEWIKSQIRTETYLWSLHADEERRNDQLKVDEVTSALLNGKILEIYPRDRRGASCLIYGKSGNSPVHIVCGKNILGRLVIITVYKPRMPKWKTPTERSKT
ncbi:MAG: DUF4258 domain-containing protein [Chlamydiae bacterium]|nr:DUF4258 domain-containing protein [Chlamydiota bacterium]MBI3276373.1 DUF4258 domain-containing protein [Chlamydiota bacterium]